MKKIVEIESRLVIPFDFSDPTPGGRNLGRAEFLACVKFGRSGRISEFWVDPVQTRIKEMWHYSGGDIDFTISAYEGLESQGFWVSSYCKFHKATALRFYAPVGARFLSIDYHGVSFSKNKF